MYRAVYIHRKYLKYYKDIGRKSKKKEKFDKAERQNTNPKKNKTLIHDSILEQTVRFAKSLVPAAIPPSRDKSPVYYTIKASKGHRKKSKPENNDLREKDKMTKKKEGKKVKERISKDNFNANEFLTPSESNTLDDLQLNQSMTCTDSETFDAKYKKDKENTVHSKIKNINSVSVQKIRNVDGDTEIKALVMNESDINTLAESIQEPILNALKGCLGDIKALACKDNMKSLQTHLLCNTQKLDNILVTLACIEKKLDAHIEKTTVRNVVKSSRLEELSKDVIKEELSSEEELLEVNRDNSDVVEFIYNDNVIKGNLGCGEVQDKKTSASVGVKTDRPNRIPARFCWTDTVTKN